MEYHLTKELGSWLVSSLLRDCGMLLITFCWIKRKILGHFAQIKRG